MGMYTGLRGKIALKDNDTGNAVRIWLENYDILMHSLWRFVSMNCEDEDINTLQEWFEVGRCNFIPCGAMCYMPAEWGDTFYSVEGNVMSFACSLKNYQNEIGFFIESVLPLIGDAWDLEELYEEDDVPTKHAHLTVLSQSALEVDK